MVDKLKIDEIPQHLIDIYMAETKIKTNKGSYVDDYTKIREVILKYLDKFQQGWYTYRQDAVGNIYVEPQKSQNKNIVLAAHMDKVHTNGRIDKLFYDQNNGQLFAKNKDKKQTSLGADDKNGIFCILEMYKRLKHEELPSAVFTVGEEIGCVGSSQIDKTFFEDKEYCIVIDRRNRHDLIYKGGSTLYGIKTPPTFKMFNPQYEYTEGATSDANQFSAFVDCMNVSCGYYNPHSSTEYTVVHELIETCDAVETFVLNANTVPLSSSDSLEFLQKIRQPSYGYYNYSHYNKKNNKVTDLTAYRNSGHGYYDDSLWDAYANYGDYADYEDDIDAETAKKFGLTDCPYCKAKNCYSKKDNQCLWCDCKPVAKGGEKKDAEVSSMQQDNKPQGNSLEQKDK